MRSMSPSSVSELRILAIASIAAMVTLKAARALLSKPIPGILHFPIPSHYSKVKFFFVRYFGILLTQKDFGSIQLDAFTSSVDEHGAAGSVLGFEPLPGKRRLMVAGMEDIEYMLSKPRAYVKDNDYESLHPILGDENLVTIRDENVHAVQRRLVAPSFSPVTLRHIANTIVTAHTEGMMMALEGTVKSAGKGNRKKLCLSNYFDQVTLNIIASSAFRQKASFTSDVPAARYFREILSGADLFRAFLVNWMPKPLRFLGRQKTVEENVGKLRVMGAEIAAQAREQIREEEQQDGAESLNSSVSSASTSSNSASGKTTKVLVDHLVLEKDLSEKAMLDHMITFLFAGHETTSRALEWICYMLSRNPKCQELLYEELSNAFGGNVIPTLDVVKDLQYLGNVIQEGLRLYPPVPVLIRMASEDDVLPYSKAFVPKGTMISLNIISSLRLSTTYDRPLEFDPSRWEGGISKTKASAQMMFSHGKRNCIGKDFAMNELLIILATLLRRYKVTLPAGQAAPQREMKVTIRPREELFFELEAREQ